MPTATLLALSVVAQGSCLMWLSSARGLSAIVAIVCMGSVAWIFGKLWQKRRQCPSLDFLLVTGGFGGGGMLIGVVLDTPGLLLSQGGACSLSHMHLHQSPGETGKWMLACMLCLCVLPCGWLCQRTPTPHRMANVVVHLVATCGMFAGMQFGGLWGIRLVADFLRDSRLRRRL